MKYEVIGIKYRRCAALVSSIAAAQLSYQVSRNAQK
jgi:hypothetical protein